MSIILKGIDMTSDGKPIRLVITSNGDVVEVWRDGLAKAYHPNCAIQIPKGHGRLIDEIEVKKAQFIINDQWGSYPVISLGNLHCAPTILEAEEGKNER